MRSSLPGLRRKGSAPAIRKLKEGRIAEAPCNGAGLAEVLMVCDSLTGLCVVSVPAQRALSGGRSLRSDEPPVSSRAVTANKGTTMPGHGLTLGTRGGWRH